MKTLRGKNVAYLKKLAHSMKPIFQIGKDGINEQQVIEILRCLEKQELIKVKKLETCLDSRDDIRATFEANDIFVISVVGNTFILYKESTILKQDKKIELPF